MERTRSAARRAASRLHMQVVIQQDPASGDQDPNVVHVVIEDGGALEVADDGQEIRIEPEHSRLKDSDNSLTASARPYPCAFCTSRFALKSSLRRHVRSQHANHPEREVMLRKAFECRLCHSEFTTNSDLWFHRQTVHGAGAGCRVSNATKAASDARDGLPAETNDDGCVGDRNEENEADDQGGFTCVLCTFTYRKVQDLKRHIRRRHPEALSKNGHDVGALASSLVMDNGDPLHASEPVRVCAITPANLHGDLVTRVPATTQLAVRCARSNGNTRRVVEELLQLEAPQDEEEVLLTTSEHYICPND